MRRKAKAWTPNSSIRQHKKWVFPKPLKKKENYCRKNIVKIYNNIKKFKKSRTWVIKKQSRKHIKTQIRMPRNI